MTTTPLKTFIIYAREDRASLDLLMGHLSVFARSGATQFWYDREIIGGKDWDEEIRFNLKNADIVLLLISPAFFNSDYIHSVELSEALQRDRDKEARVVPVILKKCLWHKYPELARLQALPAEAKPVYDKNHWPDPDDAFYDVGEGFDRILEDPETEARRQRKQARIEAEVAAEHQRQAEEARLHKQKEAAAEKKRKEAAEQKRQAEEAARKEGLPESVLVKGGTFTMGCTAEQGSDCNDWEKPAHKVTLPDFYIGRTAVTVAQFAAFVEDSGYRTEAEQGGGSYIWSGSEWKMTKGVDWRCDEKGKPRSQEGHDHPVIHVSWNDALAYCEWLSSKHGGRFRLPSEAEWEYAARGGLLSKGYKYAGSNGLEEVAWYSENSGSKTHPVAQKSPNELGLYDMSGNVWEWCADDWHDNYKKAPADGSAWVDGPQRGSRRVRRGGSWLNGAGYCRVSNRSANLPDSRDGGNGFRVALVP